MRKFLFVAACCTLLCVPIASHTEEAKSSPSDDCCSEEPADGRIVVHYIVIGEDGYFCGGGTKCSDVYVQGGEFIAWRLADNYPKEQRSIGFKKKDIDDLFGISAPKIVITKREWTWLRVRNSATPGTYEYDGTTTQPGGGVIVCQPNATHCP